MATLHHQHGDGRGEREPSSPLSSLPSSYHSLPPVTSMPAASLLPRPPTPTPLSLPLPDVELSSPSIRRSSILLSFPFPLPFDPEVNHALGEDDREFGIVLPSEGQDSAVGNVSNALGLYVDHHRDPASSTRISRARKPVDDEPISKPARKEKTFILRKPAPRYQSAVRRNPDQHQQSVGNFDSFSSLESVAGGWPPSPSVTRSWKLTITTANNLSHVAGGGGGKRKQNTSDDRDGIEDILDGAPTKAKKARVNDAQWTSRHLHLSVEHQHDTSPDYRGMLNLSSDPPAPAEPGTNLANTNVDPFTQSQPATRPTTFQVFKASAEGDGSDRLQSLSPTIRNPSIGTMDSEDLSIVCLAPAAGDAREVSFGRFGCSGDWEGNVAAVATPDKLEVKKMKEREEERRLADVIERWMKGHAQASTASAERSSRNATGRHGNVSSATTAATPVCETSGGKAYRLNAKSGEVSIGLLDAVCNSEALAYERATGIVNISTAPEDLGMWAAQAAAGLARFSSKGDPPIRNAVERDDVKQEGQRSTRLKGWTDTFMKGSNVGPTSYAVSISHSNPWQRRVAADSGSWNHRLVSEPAVPNNKDAIALTLTLSIPPLFHIWVEDPGTWKTVGAFIETNDLMTHSLIGDRTTLLPKVERILTRTTDNQARMFQVPYNYSQLNKASQPFMASRLFRQGEPAREVIDLVTPPRPATAEQSYQGAPRHANTPARDCAGLNKRLLQKKKLGKDSSRVKMSIKGINKKMPLQAGSYQPSKGKVFVPYPYVQPPVPTRLTAQVPIREATTAGNINPSHQVPSLQSTCQQTLDIPSQLEQYSFPHPLPLQDENSQWQAHATRSAASSTCDPHMIQPPAAYHPYHIGSVNTTGPFAALSAFYYPYYAQSSSQIQMAAPRAIAENYQQTSTTSQATDISAAVAGRQAPHH
ncbi:hypothetical protein QFC22_005970 [Naganishia vaughanmartiniae]|uniref:Uncharacterized protein n=1 Tax=Naganishia vaughanmartiniae TaxID=1424756 RepID=A0ACC2WQH6_9TREE|nr:hypothetical protein QFC22_005970 [Naganishia vaughanmartiniae]